MGLWDATDFVTQLPIPGNTPIRAIFAQQYKYTPQSGKGGPPHIQSYVAHSVLAEKIIEICYTRLKELN